MGREADADEQLLRRRRRLFAVEERSFRIDRRSPAAAALRVAVSDVLPRFLASYTDDTLAEYIVVLVCNGKHQYQACDDLEAFLGDDSANFVAWLWGYLSKMNFALADNSCVRHGVGDENWKLNHKKTLLDAEVLPGDAHLVNSKYLDPQEQPDPHKLDSTKGQNVAQRRISSAVTISPERLFGDQWYLESQHHKKDQNSMVGRSFSAAKFGVAARTSQVLTQEKLHHEEHLGRNATTRRLPMAMGTDDGEVPESMKRRGNVWDRLGKPAKQDWGLARETNDMHVQNEGNKRAKVIESKHEQMCYANSSTDYDLFDETNCKKKSISYPYVNRVQEHELVKKPNRSRLIGRINFGDVERSNLQDKDVISQKSSSTILAKNVQSQCLNEFRTEVKISPTAVSELACTNKISKGHASKPSKLPQPAMQRSSGNEVLQNQQISSPTQSSKTGSSVRGNDSNCSNKPVKDEMLDMKLKLKQMELDMLKLRSKQVQINNGKLGALSSGPHANLEDADSRTVLVTNVHFAAAKEVLSTHFMKCGAVLKIDMLTDAFTGHRKGAAFVTFADNESVEKALLLNGTSFLSRVLTVLRKADTPPEFMASVQQSGRPTQTQPWNSPPLLKVVGSKQPAGYHLQWKREQSVMEKCPASCPTN